MFGQTIFFKLVLKLHRRLVRESGSIEKLKEERHNPGLPFLVATTITLEYFLSDACSRCASCCLSLHIVLKNEDRAVSMHRIQHFHLL